MYGCTIQGYENYNELANVDDGSCNYEIVYGCTIEGSQNYDPLATHNDGSCIPPDPIAPVAQYDIFIYDEEGNESPIYWLYAGYQIVLVSNSYDEDGTIVSHEWGLVVPSTEDVPYSLQNDLDAANNANDGNGLGTLTLNTTYDHIGLMVGFSLLVTDDEGYTHEISTTPILEILDPELEITGDVNNDYSVDVIDVVAVVNYVLGNDNLVGVSLQQADVNGDGIIDVLDIVGLVNIIMGDTE